MFLFSKPHNVVDLIKTDHDKVRRVDTLRAS